MRKMQRAETIIKRISNHQERIYRANQAIRNEIDNVLAGPLGKAFITPTGMKLGLIQIEHMLLAERPRHIEALEQMGIICLTMANEYPMCTTYNVMALSHLFAPVPQGDLIPKYSLTYYHKNTPEKGIEITGLAVTPAAEGLITNAFYTGNPPPPGENTQARPITEGNPGPSPEPKKKATWGELKEKIGYKEEP